MRSALFAILALPGLFAGLGVWETWRGAGTRSEYASLASDQLARAATLIDQQRHETEIRTRLPARPDAPAIAAAIKPPQTARDEAEIDLLVARVREAIAWLCLLGSIAAGLAGAGGLVLVSRAARIGAQSRPKLVGAFGRVSRLLPVALGVQIVGAVLAVAAAVTFEVSGLWFTPDPGGNTVILAILVLGYAGFAIWGGVATLRRLRLALQSFVPIPLAVPAMPIVEAQAPGLFAMLRDLARAGGATPPDVVAVGATAGFFVTAFPLLLYGAPGAPGVTTRGRTLHLSLPEMATLDIAEVRTVLAHELAHFSGEDTDYSVRFQPLYAGLGQGADAMALRQIDWGGTWLDRLLERAVHPHTTLAVQAYERFSHVVAHWDRVRELEADRAAIAAGSGAALASSLLRTGIAAALVRDALAHIAEHPDEASPDITAALVARMGADGANDAAAHLGDHAPHPTDTHPPTWQRIEAAGVAVDEKLLARAARPVDPGDFVAMQALFTDWDALASLITAPLRARALQQQEDRRAELRAAAAATVGAGETALYASLLRPALGLTVLGLICLVIGVTCVLAALYGGDQDRDSWRLLAGVAAACAVGLGFVALWSFRLWRGRAIPYLVLSENGLRSPGLDGVVTWLDVIRIGVSSRQSPTTWFVLRPDAALPRRTGLIRLLQIDGEKRAIQFMGLLPQGLTETALRTLLLRYANAAHARDSLQADCPAGYNDPVRVVPTEEDFR